MYFLYLIPIEKLLSVNRLYFLIILHIRITMRTNLLKVLDLLIFCKYSLNCNCFRLKFGDFVTNQLNISKFSECTMRVNLLNCCNLVSISKNVVFYVFGKVCFVLPKIDDFSYASSLHKLL